MQPKPITKISIRMLVLKNFGPVHKMTRADKGKANDMYLRYCNGFHQSGHITDAEFKDWTKYHMIKLDTVNNIHKKT